MTRDEILNMPAGREMDLLIAEKFSLYTRSPNPGNHVYIGTHILYFPSFSTDISAAWEVMEKLKKDGKWISVTTSLLGFDDQWCCEYSDNNVNSEVNVSMADTAPLAICRAALLGELEKV